MSRLRPALRLAATGLVAAVAIALFPATTASGALLSGRPASLYYASDLSKAWVYTQHRPPQVRVHSEVVGSMIASQPTGIWLSDWSNQGYGQITELVAREVARASEQNKAPIFVPYMLPNRDCGNLSAGGAPNHVMWRSWIQRLAWGIAAGLSERPSPNLSIYIMLEPDAIALQSGDADCKDADGNRVTFDNDQRNSDLRYAVEFLTNAACLDPTKSACPWWQSHVKVFLDTGHSLWYGTEARRRLMADRLRAAGVEGAAGFYSNASNYQPTANEVAYGQALRALLQDPRAPYQKIHVIDTSRNGAPIPRDRQADTGWPDWCDPSAARLGEPPTTNTGVPLMMTMWIKPPGETDGCYGGENTTGTPGRDGRGVPWHGYPAGTFRHDLACRLITGSTTCPERDFYSTAPPTPTGLRITSVTTDQVTLQWKPSLGACAYQIGYRINGSSGGYIYAIVAFGEGSVAAPWPPPAYYLTGSQVKHGAKVEYAVRARSCGVTPYYSPYSATVVTYDYP